MRNAKERYELSVENGKKGGRPTAVTIEDIVGMKQEGKTNKQIADIFGLSEKTVENRITTYNKSHPHNTYNHPITPGLQGKGNDDTYPPNPHNLSVSDTVSESVSSTDTETDSSRIAENIIYPETMGEAIVSEPDISTSKDKPFISGDGLPGRRIRDLSDNEVTEIKTKLKKSVSYLDMEREYGMRRGTITAKFDEHRRACVCAKVSGRI